VVWWKGWVCSPCYLLPLLSFLFFSTSFLPSLCPLLYPSPRPIGVGCLLFVVGSDQWMRWRRVRRLVAFSGVSNSDRFDHDFDFDHSTFYSSRKIVKINIYILYTHKNVSYNLFREILNYGFGYVVLSFQSYKIYIYIDIPRWF
jgi:hypothetical protein